MKSGKGPMNNDLVKIKTEIIPKFSLTPRLLRSGKVNTKVYSDYLNYVTLNINFNKLKFMVPLKYRNVRVNYFRY